MSMIPGVKAAVDAKGGFRGLARALGLDHRTVMYWAETEVPANRLLLIEEKTDVPRHELRPDLYVGYVVETKNYKRRARRR